jgi:hypothetical protein
MAAALLVAAAVAATLGAVQWRMRGTQARAVAAAAAPVVAQPPPAEIAETPPPPSAPPASAAAAATGTATTAAAPTEAVPRAPASTSKPASRRPPWRAWTAAPKRASPGSGDNPY